MSLSELLFYGGIVGMAGTALVGITVVLMMLAGKKRLLKKLDTEYGESK